MLINSQHQAVHEHAVQLYKKGCRVSVLLWVYYRVFSNDLLFSLHNVQIKSLYNFHTYLMLFRAAM